MFTCCNKVLASHVLFVRYPLRYSNCKLDGSFSTKRSTESMGAYLRALVFLLLRLRRRTRFFLHFALMVNN